MPGGKSLNSGKMCHAYHREMKFESCINCVFCKKAPQGFWGHIWLWLCTLFGTIYTPVGCAALSSGTCLGSLLLIPPLLHQVWMICQFFLNFFFSLLNPIFGRSTWDSVTGTLVFIDVYVDFVDLFAWFLWLGFCCCCLGFLVFFVCFCFGVFWGVFWLIFV